MDPPPEETPARDWSLLPLDALSSVFVRVGAVDILMGAGLVCRSWLQAAKVPDVWRVVDMESHHAVFEKRHFVLRAMAKAAVDRSDGQLRIFAGKEFVTDELIRYIVERCFSLSLYTCFHKSFQILFMHSLLDHPMKEIVFFCRSPTLTTLRLVSCFSGVFDSLLPSGREESTLNLRELRSLELDDVDVTPGELYNVLENCPVLEVLRVHYCSGIYDEDAHALRAKFARIETLTLDCDEELPYDSDFGWDDYVLDYVPDFEDERTDDGSR
jgi:hypothetical protein